MDTENPKSFRFMIVTEITLLVIGIIINLSILDFLFGITELSRKRLRADPIRNESHVILFLKNLAVADSLFIIAMLFRTFKSWTLGVTVCKIITSIDVAFQTISIFFVGIIATDRLVRTTRILPMNTPFVYRLRRIVAAFVWLLLLCGSSFIWQLTDVREDRERSSRDNSTALHCGLYFDMWANATERYKELQSIGINDTREQIVREIEQEGRRKFMWTMLTVGLIGPGLWFTLCYTKIGYDIRRHSLKSTRRETHKLVNSTIQNMTTIVAAFLFTWAPFYIIRLAYEYDQHSINGPLEVIYEAAFKITELLAATNMIVINPVLSLVNDSRLREKFLHRHNSTCGIVKRVLSRNHSTVKTIGESLPESPENIRSEVTAGTFLDPRSRIAEDGSSSSPPVAANNTLVVPL